MEFLGKMVKKEFKGFGLFEGVVDSFDSSTGFFKIMYEDGDSEEVDYAEIARLVSIADSVPAPEELPAKRVGRKPKRRRRVCRDPGKGSDNLAVHSSLEQSKIDGIEDGLEQNLAGQICVSGNDDGDDCGLDLNRGLNFDEGMEKAEIRECIDLNLTVVNNEFDEGVEKGKIERDFDLNLGFNDDHLSGVNDTLVSDAYVGSVEEVPNGGDVACSNIPESSVDANLVNSSKESQFHVEDNCPDMVALTPTPIPSEDANSGRRKRRRVARNLTSPTETVLRRSARRAKAMMALNDFNSSGVMSSDGANDLSMSGITEESEEKPSAMELERPREPWVLPLRMELPPSSTNINLEGVPVLDLFFVYSCLRSFSTLLYLSPFELEDLVAALKSRVSNLLIDFIHVSILQTLRKHLEFLANEGCESASTCLRNMNWDLLDVITWPVFMVDYLLIHGSGLRPGFSLDSLNLFDGEYYSQPAEVKLELLRCLCDNVIEVEATRSELNKRMIMADATMEIDRTTGNDIYRKRRISSGVRADIGLSEDMAGEVADGNSDECCLCKMDGNLICCDGCPAAYHSKCVGIVSSLLPEGDWYCPECTVGKFNLGPKPQKLIRGADLLGIDPYGRLYFRCFDYLLVSDSYDAESSFNYYHKDDLGAVIQLLRSYDILYESILSAISQQWAIPTDFCEPKSDLESKSCMLNSGTIDERKTVHAVTCTGEIENPPTSSEGSAEVLQSNDSNQLTPNSPRPGSSEVAGEALGTNSSSAAKKRTRNRSSAGRGRSIVKTKEEDFIQGHSGDVYMNCYSFACVASSVVEELLRKPSDKVNADAPMTEEEIISIQLKFILRKSTKFCWPSMQDLDVDRQKEKCGWCYCCRFPVEGRECLFSFVNQTPVPKGLKAELDAFLSKKNKKGHLSDVICCMLLLEQRLRGLLVGPWLIPSYSELWRKSVLRASDVSSLKRPLLMLEFNLHPLSMSADWWKHVDSVATMGSASHFVASSRVASKGGINRRKVRCGVSEIKSLIAAGGLGLFWRRGGKVSRSLFNWKVVPRSLALKAARNAGRIKIPGILYPDGSENARRSKCIAWRAAVETAKSVEQFALQVRELDMFLRWDDIENTHPHSLLDKESIKSIRLFKKAIVRRKCVEGTVVKYLLDFGKRRCIPDVVIKHGTKVEDPAGEKKKYWLEESYVPLHLLKSFEERRIIRKESKTSLSKAQKGGKVKKKPLRKKGFDYLFSRADIADSYQCGHCNKHVLISEAVSCEHCNGFFHKRHVTRSSESVTSEGAYTCHKCRVGKRVKNESKLGKRKWGKLQDTKNLKVDRRGRPSKLRAKAHESGKALANGMVVPSGKNKKVKYRGKRSQEDASVPSGMTLRRSARKAAATYTPVQSSSFAGGKKKKRKRNKNRKVAAKETTKSTSCQKRRTEVSRSFWINGLLLSKKPNDERVVQFKRRKLLIPSESLPGIDDLPKCSLCSEQGLASSSAYIACETCGGWFHGDAFGLNEENIECLIGFKCHVCREKSPPVCLFHDISRDTNEATTHNAQESPEEVQVQKEPDRVLELHSDDVPAGQLETQTVDNPDEKIHIVDNTDPSADHGKTPIPESELIVDHGWERSSPDRHEGIVNAIEIQHKAEADLSVVENGPLAGEEVIGNAVESQRGDHTDLSPNGGSRSHLEVQTLKLPTGNLDQSKNLIVDPDLQMGNESSASGETMMDANDGHNENSEIQALENSVGDFDQARTGMLDSELSIENRSIFNGDILKVCVEESQCDDVSQSRLGVQTEKLSLGNLDEVKTRALDPQLRMENGSLDSKELVLDASDCQKEDLDANEY